MTCAMRVGKDEGMSHHIPSSVRKFINERDTRCVRCGGTDRLELSHRMRRREGGHKPYNIVRLCHTCHAWCHSNPMEALRTGYFISAFLGQYEVINTPILTRVGWKRLNVSGYWTDA